MSQPFHHLAQRSAEWFAARASLACTASELASVCGFGYESRNAILKRKRNGTSVFETEAMRHGTIKESVALGFLEKFLQQHINSLGLLVWPDQRYEKLFGGSPDGYICALDQIVEIKCPFSGILPKQPPPMHLLQCLANMVFSSTEVCYLAYYVEDHTGMANMQIFDLYGKKEANEALLNWFAKEHFLPFVDKLNNRDAPLYGRVDSKDKVYSQNKLLTHFDFEPL
jgi:putative phage-type endonuclease